MKWYAFTTAPQKEFTARNELQRRGIKVYVPYKRDKREYGVYKKLRTIRRPLMPGYVLARIGAQDWGAIRSIREVHRPLGGDNPLTLSSEQINGVRIAAVELCRPKKGPAFAVGQPVVIMSGASAEDKVHIVKGMDRKGRPILSLELFGSFRDVSVSLEHVEAA